MTVDLESVKDETVERDENGDLIPEEKEIQWDGESETIEVKPFVTGMGNRLAKHDEGLQELDPTAVASVISVMCPDLEGIKPEHVRDLPMAKVNAIVNAITEELPEEYDTEGEGGAGNPR